MIVLVMFLVEHKSGAIQGFYSNRSLPAESFAELLGLDKKLNVDYSNVLL